MGPLLAELAKDELIGRAREADLARAIDPTEYRLQRTAEGPLSGAVRVQQRAVDVEKKNG